MSKEELRAYLKGFKSLQPPPPVLVTVLPSFLDRNWSSEYVLLLSYVPSGLNVLKRPLPSCNPAKTAYLNRGLVNDLVVNELQ